MSSSLVVIGTPTVRAVQHRVGAIADSFNVAVSFEVHPSVRVISEILAVDTDCCFQVDAPESGTATELEKECAALGRSARLPRVLEAVAEQELLSRVRLAWSWDFPDPSLIRHETGTIADLVTMLSRPQTWGQLGEIRPGAFCLSYEGILVFHLTR